MHSHLPRHYFHGLANPFHWLGCDLSIDIFMRMILLMHWTATYYTNIGLISQYSIRNWIAIVEVHTLVFTFDSKVCALKCLTSACRFASFVESCQRSLGQPTPMIFYEIGNVEVPEFASELWKRNRWGTSIPNSAEGWAKTMNDSVSLKGPLGWAYHHCVITCWICIESELVRS